VCAEVLQEAQKPKNPLRIQGEKLRRNDTIVNMQERLKTKSSPKQGKGRGL
jgi:hypothetical protein